MGKQLVNYLDSSSSLDAISNTCILMTVPFIVVTWSRLCMACSRSYVTIVSETEERACPKHTSSIQAKNSLYPVSVGCGTRLVTSFVGVFLVKE